MLRPILCGRPARAVSLVLLGLALVTLQGCAAVGLTLLGVGAGTASGTGIGHALDSITYKTFTVPLDGLAMATLMTLDRMDMPVMENRPTEEGRTILAQAGDREVEIELDRLTTTTTRMRVVAKKNWLVRDRATAAEVIFQTDHTLTDHPQLAVTPASRRATRAQKSGR